MYRGGGSEVRADPNPSLQPSSGPGPRGSFPGVQGPGLPGTALPPGPNPWGVPSALHTRSSLKPWQVGFLSSSFLTLQVGVTVLEAQKLVGVNINPYVAVRVGEQRRQTATQRGTNCPFYNEVGTTREGGA